MAYLGLSPDYPDQYFSVEPEHNCGVYCVWLAQKKAGSLTMDYMERPPGCTCPDEIDAKKQGFPVTKTGAEQYDLIEQRVQPTLTPIQQAPAQGGGLALAAIAALLLLG